MRYEAGGGSPVKTTGKLRSCILGALNGVVYSATMLLMIWRLRALADERNLARWAITGDFIDLVSHERWHSIVIIWLLAFTLASLIVSRFWRRKQNILFWVIVGVVAVAAWNGFALFGVWFDYYFSGDTISYTLVTSLSNPLFGPISFAVVILVNLVYGYLVRFFEPKTHEGEEMDLRSAS